MHHAGWSANCNAEFQILHYEMLHIASSIYGREIIP